MDPTVTYHKLSVHKLSTDIRQAAQLNETNLHPPGSDEILVRNYYAGVNALDINIITGRSMFFNGTFPFDIGMEGLGIAEAVGDDIVDEVPIGQIGLVIALKPKTYSEYVYAKKDEFIAVQQMKPEYIALLDCGLTASIGLDQSAMIKSGEVVLITAAAGGTGHIAVQWAKQKGCKVIGLCSTEEKADFLRKIGCDRPINYRLESVPEVLSTEFPCGVDVIWETIGGQMFETLFEHLAFKGRIIIVGSISGYKTVGFTDIGIKNLPSKMLSKSSSIIGFRFRHYQKYFPQYMSQLIELYESQQLAVRLDTTNANGKPFSGLESVMDAYEKLQSGTNVGKVVVELRAK